MPHFIMDCSKNILKYHTEKQVIQQLHQTAFATGLFDEGDIKARINTFETFLVGNSDNDFIHVFSHIM